MNEFALLGMVGGAMLALMLVLGTIWFILNRAAKVEDLIATVPESYSALRGVNLEQMKKMPGYKPEVETFYTKDIQDGFAVIAKGLGINEEKLTYLVIAYGSKPNGNLPPVELYIFRVKDSYDRSKVDKIENIRTAKDSSGRTFHAFEGTHELPFLKGTVVECPTKNLVVATRFDQDGVAAAEVTAVANAKKSDGTQKKIGDIGKIAAKGHFWTIFRAEGQTKGMFDGIAAYSAADKMDKLSKNTKSATAFAMWATYGSAGLRCGAGIECASSSDAKELVKYMQEGPLGKADESEAPNYMRVNLQIVGMKKVWGEFLQSLSFNQQGNAAFIRVKSDNPDNMRIVFNFFTLENVFGKMHAANLAPATPP
jgi:hypothetical protein